MGRRGRVVLIAALATVVAASCVTTSPAAVARPATTPTGNVSGRCVPTGNIALTPGRQRIDLVVNGEARWSYVQLPAGYDGTTRAPLVLSLHPFVMTPDVWEDYSGFAAAAAGRGFVVATPLGSDPGPRWGVPGGLAGSDDLAFIDALVARLRSDLCIDSARIYAAGFSAGAAMAIGLSCTFPGLFAGVAASGGSNLTALCPQSAGVNTLILHGQDDPIAPPTGSTVVFAPPMGLHVDDVVASTATRSTCDPTPTIARRFPTVDVATYHGCSAGHRLEYWKMYGTGHTWAGAQASLFQVLAGIILGPTNQDFSANQVVLDFFA